MSKPNAKEKTIRGKVIPSLITTAIVSIITTAIPGGWGWVGGKILQLCKWLISPVSIPIWLLILLSLVAVTFAVLVGIFIYAANRREASVTANYTEDTLFGIRWRWKWSSFGIDGPFSFCPRCDLQIYPRRSSGFNALDGVEYHCEDCGVVLNKFERDHDWVEDRVKRKIQQKLRQQSREADAEAA
jgi:hypothetical protein